MKRTLLTYAKKVTVSVLYWYVRSFGTSESLERPRKGSIFFCLRSFSGRLSVFDFGLTLGLNEGVLVVAAALQEIPVTDHCDWCVGALVLTLGFE